MPLKPWLDEQEMGPEEPESYLDAPVPVAPSGPKPMDPKVRQYMMEKYFEASDRSGVQGAQKNAGLMQLAGAGVQALSQATQGDTRPQVFKKGWNETGRPEMTDPYDSKVDTSALSRAGDSMVKRAEADRAAKIQDFEMGNKLETQARNDAMQDEKLGMERESHGARMQKAQMDAEYEASRRDPDSDASKGFRALIGKVSPSLAPSLEGMSLADAERVVPGLVNSYEARLARQQQAGLSAQARDAATSARAAERGDKHVGDLRKEYAGSQVFKNSQEMEQARSRAQKAAATKTPSGDIALIFSAMKMNDPGSTVREGEFAMLAKSGSFGEQMKAMVEKAETGQLTDEKRAEILATIDSLYNGQMGELDRHDAYFSDLAGKMGVPVDQVVRPRTKVPAQTGPAPEAANPPTTSKPSWAK